LNLLNSDVKDSSNKGIELTTMSKNKGYFTVRLSTFYGDLIDTYIETHRTDARFGGQRLSRATVARLALDAFFQTEGLIPATAPDAPPEYLKRGQELLFAHTIVNLARGEHLPSDHHDVHTLTTYIHHILEKIESETRTKMKAAHRAAIVDALLQYHQQLLDMVPMIG
jgi:hypothetical protein